MSRTRFAARILVPQTPFASSACEPSTEKGDMRSPVVKDNADRMRHSLSTKNVVTTITALAEVGELATAERTFQRSLWSDIRKAGACG